MDTAPLKDSEVRVWLRDREGRHTAGTLAAIGSSLIGVDVSDDDGPVFLTGAHVTLDVRMPDLDEPIRAPATVAHRSVGRGRRHYELVLDDTEQMLPFAVRATLNRREAVRVAAPHVAPVVATLRVRGETTELQAPLTDISSDGIGICLAFPHDRSLVVGDLVDVLIDLPNGQGRPLLSARVFHARALGSEVYMGLGFVDPETGTAPAPQSPDRTAITGFAHALRASKEQASAA